MADLTLLRQLLHKNAEWAKRTAGDESPNFFEKLANPPGQQPSILWIGCSDSRVPESVVTDSLPGVFFVHRNIANQVPLRDDNTMSVVGYSVNHLSSIKHIIVVGHTQCGGCEAALQQVLPTPSNQDTEPKLSNAPEPRLGRWIQPIVELARSLGFQPGVNSPAEALQILIRENVVRQVRNLLGSEAVKSTTRKVYIHGWMYNLRTGCLDDLNITHTVPASTS